LGKPFGRTDIAEEYKLGFIVAIVNVLKAIFNISVFN